MKNNLRLGLSILLMTAIFGCSANPVTTGNEILVNEIKNYDSVYVAKITEKSGASISFRINTPQSGFNTKAVPVTNTNGTPAKTAANVDHYLVYLIKNNSGGYPAGGDPLGATDLVAGPFTIPNAGASSKTVTFTNIQPSGASVYYVAARAQDAANVDIIKDNNASVTAWTGTTAATPKVAVSTGNGISVDNAYVVTPTTALAVSPNLLNAIGATFDANIIPNAGVFADTVAVNPLSDFITTVAGDGTAAFGGDSGPATSAQLNGPNAMKTDSLGNLYIADSNNRIRKVDKTTGVISTVAGDGNAAFGGDSGPATSAQINNPRGIALDSSDNLYISDSNNNRIRKVDKITGIITTAAGNNIVGTFSGDGGPATSSELDSPRGIAIDNSGNIYFSDAGNHRIRKVNVSSGIITTIAGNPAATAGAAASGFSGDGSPATSALLTAPNGMAMDSAGNIYIADTGNQRIRKVTATTGIINTIAGTGTAGFIDNTAATSAQMNNPFGVAVDTSGNIYIADSNNQRIRKITTTTGIITTIAGTGTAGFIDNTAATSAQMNNPFGVAVDTSGNIYISDLSNNRIRKIYKN